MYQTRSYRKATLLKDKANIVSLKSDDISSNNLQVNLPKKASNLHKINLRKRETELVYKNNLFNSNITVSSNKENVGDLLQKNGRKDKSKEPNADKEIIVIKKTKNSVERKQEGQNNTKINKILVERDVIEDKPFNKLGNTVPKSLIYNKFLQNKTNLTNKRKKRTVADVYDISDDEDLEKEKQDLKKIKNMKSQDKKKIKMNRLKNGKKNIKKTPKVQIYVDATKSNIISIDHQLTSEQPVDLNKSQHFANPLTNDPKNNPLKDISAIMTNSHCSRSKKLKKVEFSKPVYNASINKENKNNKMESNEHCLMENTENKVNKTKDSGKIILRQATPERELGLRAPISTNDNLSSLDSMPQTSTPQNGNHPYPNFDLEHQFSFAAHMSKIPLSPFEAAPTFKFCEKLCKESPNDLNYANENVPEVPANSTPPPENVCQRSCHKQYTTPTPENVPEKRSCPEQHMTHSPEDVLQKRSCKEKHMAPLPENVCQERSCQEKHRTPPPENVHRKRSCQEQYTTPPTENVRQKRSCQEQQAANYVFEIFLDDIEEDVPSDEENDLEYVTANYSLALFGSPEKNPDEKINLKQVKHCITADIQTNKTTKNDIQSNKTSKNKKAAEPCCTKSDLVEKKTAAEVKQEEAFYKSFNEQLSELDDYELCIE